MARGYPQSQTRALLQKKETLAFRLLAQGLTAQQVCRQLTCSQAFVRRIKREMYGGEQSRAQDVAPTGNESDLIATRSVGGDPEDEILLEQESAHISPAHGREDERQMVRSGT